MKNTQYNNLMTPQEFSRLRSYWTSSSPSHRPTWRGTSRRKSKSARFSNQTTDERKLTFNKPIMQNNVKILSYKKTIAQKNDGTWFAKP